MSNRDSSGLAGPPPASAVFRPLPRLTLRLPIDPARLLRARQRIRDYLYAQSIDETFVDDVVLAVEEAMSNAVHHSGAHEDLEVELSFSGVDLLATVKDHGTGFDTSSFDPERLPDLDALGGRGLFLIARLTDELELITGDGLEVRMVKHGVLAYGQRSAARLTLPGALSDRDVRERVMLDEIEDEFIAFDWEYHLIHANAPVRRYAAASGADLLGQTFWDLLGDRTTPVGEAAQKAMQFGIPAVVEYPSILAPGHWFEARVYPAAFGLSVFSVDVTARRAAEAALRESEARLRTVARAGRIGIVEWNVSRNVAYWSPEQYELFGLQPDRPLAWQEWVACVHPEDRPRVEESAAQLLERGRRQRHVRGYTDEYRFIRPDGSLVWVEANMALDVAGGETIIRGSVRDITERKQAEAALDEMRFVFSEGQRIAHVGTFEYIAATQATVWSDEECRIYGLEAGTPSPTYEELLARFIHPDDVARLDTTFRQAMETGSVYELEHRIVRPTARYALSITALAPTSTTPAGCCATSARRST